MKSVLIIQLVTAIKGAGPIQTLTTDELYPVQKKLWHIT